MMINVGHFAFLISFVCIIFKLALSQYVDATELDLDIVNNANTYIFDFLILICCVLYLKYTDVVFRPLFYSFVIFTPLFAFSTFAAGGEAGAAVASSLRWFLPFFLIAFYCSYFKRHDNFFDVASSLIIFVCLTCFIYGFLYFPMASNRFDGENEGYWWPAYFSNLHTTCYVAASVAFLFYAKFKRQTLDLRYFLTLYFAILLIVTFGWGIRTVSLMLLLFLFILSYEKYLKKITNFGFVSINIVVILGLIWYNLYFDWDYYSRLTSGRLSMYEAKLTQLSENGVMQWLIGNGVGSDLIETSFWWGVKGAHSDLITSLVEGGIVFLGLFIYLHYFLYSSFRNTNAKYFVIPILFSGIVSNGYLTRPLAMYVISFAFAGFYALSIRDSINAKRA